jgi:hypothetical protein
MCAAYGPKELAKMILPYNLLKTGKSPSPVLKKLKEFFASPYYTSLLT